MSAGLKHQDDTVSIWRNNEGNIFFMKTLSAIYETIAPDHIPVHYYKTGCY